MKDRFLNASRLRVGDILLSHGPKVHLRFIAWATKRPYSHAAIYAGHYQVFEAVRDGVGFAALEPIKVECPQGGHTRVLCSTRGYSALAVFRLPPEARPSDLQDEGSVRLGLHRVLLPLNGLDYAKLEAFANVRTKLSWAPLPIRKKLLGFAGNLFAADKDKILAGFFCSELAVSAWSALGVSVLQKSTQCSGGVAPGDLADPDITKFVRVDDAVCEEDSGIANDPMRLLTAQFEAKPGSNKHVVHATRELQTITASILDEMREARRKRRGDG